MAESKVKGINIKIGADTTGLDTALDGIENKSKKARSELVEVNRSLKSNKDSVVLWEQKQQLLSKAFDTSKEKLNMLESAQRDVTKQLENKAITGEQYRAFQRELENARAETKRFGSQLEEAENKVKELKGTADKTAESAHDLGDDLHDAGEQAEKSSGGYSVLKGTLADLAADGFKNLAGSAKEAREEINQGYETIITKTGASGEALEDFKEIANDVFSTMPVDMDDVGTAVGEINTRFDETGKTLEDMTEIFLKYARINGSDVNSSIDNVSSAMKAFNVDTSEAADVLDVLSAVGQKTGINIGSLESNLVSNSATFKEMGLSIYEAAQLLGQFEKNGVDTSTAITGLKKAQQEATSEGKTMTEALRENIVAIKNAETETEALQIATDLFGKRGASAMTQAIREGRFELSDLEGDMSVFTGTVSNTFDAVQKESDKFKVSTNKLKLELASLIEKVMPKIESMIDVFNKNLPKMIDYGKTLIPVAKGVGAAFLAWKISEKAKPGAAALKELFVSVKSGNSIMEVFNATLKANPVGAVTTAIGVATTAIDYFRNKAKQTESDRRESLAALIKDEYKEAAERIKDASENLKDMKDSFNSRASDIDSEAERTKNLWKELDNLADSSGKVQDKDKIRAEYILGELNEALGTEYTMTGNQIKNYQLMKQEIDDLIEKKKAMSYIDSYSEQSADYAKIQADSLAEYKSAKVDFDEYDKEMQKLIEEAEKITGEKFNGTYLGTGIENWIDNNIGWNNRGEGNETWEELNKILNDYNNISGNWTKTRQNMWESEAIYKEATEYLDKLDNARQAYEEGRYKDVETYLYAVKDINREILKDGSKTGEEYQKVFDRTLNECLAGLDLALQGGRKEAVSETMTTIGEIVKEGKAGGGAVSKEFLDNLKQNVNAMLDAGFDISELAKWGKESGIRVADAFDEDFYKVVQEQLDAGYDIRDLLVWGENSGYKIGDYFVDDFKDKVQDALDKGYKIDSLLDWAKESGYFIGDEAQFELMKKIQSSLDCGFNTDRLIEWAIENGISLGQLFGENFSYYVERSFWDSWESVGVQNINSASDAAKYYAGDYGIGSKSNLQFFAKGGFLGSGQGIVAEAGPELIEIINGGARITPLTGSARNTAVSGITGEGGQKNFYSSYTINATIAGRYDVTRLAEDLETERRRIEMGRGL